MSIGISGSNPAYSLLSVLDAQIKLLTEADQASSGKRITNASIDPSGLAIYNNLTSLAQGADTANLNITDASAAINVAQGATSTIQTTLTQSNNLAIEANNGFNSPTDEAALQAQISQNTQEINQIAGQTNFNGTALLDGSNSGTTPATSASATIPTNTQTNSGSTVVASVSTSPATTSGTFNVSIDQTGKADVTYQDSTTQTSSVVGSFAAGSSVTYNGTTLTFGNFTASDANATATVQTTAATTGSVAPSASIQSGASAGQTTHVDFANATTTGLGVTNLDVTNPAAATNTQGQIGNAQASLDAVDASLGAQSNALADAFNNNNIYSNNLTASASSIGDTNEAKAASDTNLTSLQQQISVSVLAGANTDAGHLNAFLSQYA
jgi:flagellin